MNLIHFHHFHNNQGIRLKCNNSTEADVSSSDFTQVTCPVCRNMVPLSSRQRHYYESTNGIDYKVCCNYVGTLSDQQLTVEPDRVECDECKRRMQERLVSKAAEPKSGLRYNAGKPRMDLISPWAAEGHAEVLTYGMKKYAAYNWAKGLSWSETVASLERHLAAFKKGEDIDRIEDGGSGLPHIDHLQANAAFLSHFQKTKTGTDDRWRLPTKKEEKKP